jgi:hypothetical protein
LQDSLASQSNEHSKKKRNQKQFLKNKLSLYMVQEIRTFKMIGKRKKKNLIEDNIGIHNNNFGRRTAQASTRNITGTAKGSSAVYIISQIVFPNNLQTNQFIKVFSSA